MSQDENRGRGAIPHTCRDRVVKRPNEAGQVEVHHFPAQDPKQCARCTADLEHVATRRGPRRCIRFLAKSVLGRDPAEKPLVDALLAALSVKRDPSLIPPPKEAKAPKAAPPKEEGKETEEAPKASRGAPRVPFVNGRSPCRNPEVGDRFDYEGRGYRVLSFTPGRGRNGATVGYTVTDNGVTTEVMTNLSRWRETFRHSRTPKPAEATGAETTPTAAQVEGAQAESPAPSETRPRFEQALDSTETPAPPVETTEPVVEAGAVAEMAPAEAQATAPD